MLLKALLALSWKRPAYHCQAAQRLCGGEAGGVSVLAVCHPVNASECCLESCGQPPTIHSLVGAWEAADLVAFVLTVATASSFVHAGNLDLNNEAHSQILALAADAVNNHPELLRKQ